MSKSRNLAVQPPFSTFPADMVAKALVEDATLKKVLRDARNRRHTPVATEQSVRENAALMDELSKGSAAALSRRIEHKELITREELVERLAGNRGWVSAAYKSGRLFSVEAPSGVKYFPAFYADGVVDRQVLGKVTKVLFGLPGASQYYFFTSKLFTLGMTPLEALAEGRVKDVLTAAAGFAVR